MEPAEVTRANAEHRVPLSPRGAPFEPSRDLADHRPRDAAYHIAHAESALTVLEHAIATVLPEAYIDALSPEMADLRTALDLAAAAPLSDAPAPPETGFHRLCAFVATYGSLEVHVRGVMPNGMCVRLDALDAMRRVGEGR